MDDKTELSLPNNEANNKSYKNKKGNLKYLMLVEMFLLRNKKCNFSKPLNLIQFTDRNHRIF